MRCHALEEKSDCKIGHEYEMEIEVSTAQLIDANKVKVMGLI